MWCAACTSASMMSTMSTKLMWWLLASFTRFAVMPSLRPSWTPVLQFSDSSFRECFRMVWAPMR